MYNLDTKRQLWADIIMKINLYSKLWIFTCIYCSYSISPYPKQVYCLSFGKKEKESHICTFKDEYI